MVFPEAFSGDPIVIDEHCAIAFVPQSRGYFLAVACSTSQRRVKVRLDLTCSTRYCVFVPVVGVVHVGPMVVEVTIAPYRVRNVGLVGPEKGAPPLPLAQLLVCLHYDVHVFLEEETGIMVSATRWRKGTRETCPAPTPSTLLPATLANAWPPWLSHLRVHDFTAWKRDEKLDAQADEGGEADKVLVQVDVVADGAAYLLSAVNKGRTPRRVLYTPPCELCGSPSVCFVPMDGHECEDAAAITGYVPGGGDVALGWVVTVDADTPPSCDQLFPSQAFTAAACNAASTEVLQLQGEKDAAPIKSTPTKRPKFVCSRTFLHSQRRSGSGGAKGGAPWGPPSLACSRRVTVGGFAPRECSRSPTNACASTTTTGNAAQAKERSTFMPSRKKADRSVSKRHQILLIGSMPGSAVQTPERREVSGLPAAQRREASCGENGTPVEQKKEAGKASHLSTEHGRRTCAIDATYVPHLREGGANLLSEVATPTAAEIERRTVSLRVTHACREEVSEDKEEKTTCVSHALRELDCEEALRRIAVEMAEATAWKVRLLEWQQPPCLICANPVPPWALFVEEPSSGERVHFLCYAEMRQPLQQQQTPHHSNDGTHCPSEVMAGREYSVEGLL
ncbi:uncharacterized protein Tco025E_01855 [Trypanosoma conorhini]|uniref:Uncharacterized protein n=1 Tax=Trypanosoma conorhini TaxID=83891 RepID=A0A3R7NYL3_9TRYP|nr:uncharacterized protein Tco025E_01855 [Trypanosoma conorhini]RNF25889.1 hypothetical protein Tco025E_01855 [Trypanosoma conorhini]